LRSFCPFNSFTCGLNFPLRTAIGSSRWCFHFH
jgi:hypothetical protein